MSQSKHTPGEWRIEVISLESEGRVQQMREINSESSVRWIARVQIPEENAYGETKAEFEANARLIAAAPELLAVLQTVKDTIVGLFDYFEPNSHEHIVLHQTRDTIDEAIKAAEGGE